MSRPSLDIYFVVPGMRFDGTTMLKESLGGAETAAVCMARELAKLGHYPTVFANLPNGPCRVDGVVYSPLEGAGAAVSRSPHDILIVQRDPASLFQRVASKQSYLWNHDLALKGFASQHQSALWNLDGVFLLSDFHIDQQLEVYPFLNREFCIKTRNGIDLKAFKPFADVKKDPKKIMYATRPERGLDNLVRPGGIMEILFKIDPRIHLYVAGYDNTTQQMAQYYQTLWGRCEQLANVTNLGPLTKAELYQHEAEASLYVYPTDFEEVSCISAMECMANGTPFVTSRLGALPETLGEKCAVYLDPPSTSQVYFNRFAKEVADLLGDEGRLTSMSKACRSKARHFEWTSVAKQWDDVFFKRFQEATADKRRLFHHFVFNDDIFVARKIATEEGLFSEVEEINEKYRWALDTETYRDEYADYSAEETKSFDAAKAADRHLNNFEVGGSIGVRWLPVKEWLLDNAKAGAKILDYGCGTGHFACAMARMGLDVTGIDLSERYVECAQGLREALRDLTNEEQGPIFISKDLFKDVPHIAFDVIFLGDVLEHVADPIALLKSLGGNLSDDGLFLITTPYGPTQTAATKRSGLRNDLHVRHFEPSDLSDMFAQKEAFGSSSIFWQFSQTTQELLGWYMTSFGKGGKYGDIDWGRKTLVQAPRDRLSVCMIVKNEETTLARCLTSLVDIAHEIIIADTGSTDNTVEIAKSFGAIVRHTDNPLQLEPLVGFEAARNASIEGAIGDWILWIDSDEELQGSSFVPKYLRNSSLDGFRVRQHHFSCRQNGQKVQVDLPTRLFRNNKGIKFFGLIHEHPETAINEGLGECLELQDVDIAHTGYYTEARRCAKFFRNLPLLAADRAKYPTRILGRFLYLRDLLQSVGVEVEKSGGALTQRTKKYCEEAVQIYRNSFLSAGGHMMEQGLGYYCQALQLLGRGRWYAMSIGVGPRTDLQPEPPKLALFETNEDFLAYVKTDLKQKSWALDGPYGVR